VLLVTSSWRERCTKHLQRSRLPLAVGQLPPTHAPLYCCCSLLCLPPWFFPPSARWCQSRQGLSWVAPSLQSCSCSFAPGLCTACRTVTGLHCHAHTHRRAVTDCAPPQPSWVSDSICRPQAGPA
jgi:hypothetical protein